MSRNHNWLPFIISTLAGILLLGIIFLAMKVPAIKEITVDNIPCQAEESLTYHVHALLVVYINDKQVQIPQGIGIDSADNCLYWVHTHDTSEVIHVEAAKKISPTLGNFLDIWKTKFANLGYISDLSSAQGWTVYTNGVLYQEAFTSIPLDEHTIITLMKNSPQAKPVTTYDWNKSGL